jgi:hypothetical protein
MKAILSRFTNRAFRPDKDAHQKSKQNEKLPAVPPPHDLPPPPTPPAALKPLAASRNPSSDGGHAPLPLPSSSRTPSPPRPPSPPALALDNHVRTDSPEPMSHTSSIATRTPADSTGRSSSRKAAAGGTLSTATSMQTQVDGGAPGASKKVAFISPPPTPGPDGALDGESPPDSTAAGPLKTNVSLFHAKHSKDPRGSTGTSSSTAAASSRTDVGMSSSKASGSTVRLPGRGAPSPFPADKASVRSGTPYSQMTYSSSRILGPTTWTDGAEEDLVINLSPRERTRQEVLWEIVASEERYALPYALTQQHSLTQT